MTLVATDRPFLSSVVAARRHLADSAHHVVLTHTDTGEELVIGPREWDALQAADGTRDLEGIRLCMQRQGRRVSTEHLQSFFASLIDAGFVGFDSEPASNEVQHRAKDPERRIHALPGYRFRCDGGGDCCATYGSVVFSPEEALAARSSCPSILDGGHHANLAFTPERGSQIEGPLCVTKVGGRCAYNSATSGCEIHRKAGAAAKPQGCQLYPLTYFDDGVTIKLSVRPECLCVFSSLEEPNAPTLQESAPESNPSLPSWVPVRTLSPVTAVGDGRHFRPLEYRQWRDTLLASCDEDALPERLWNQVSDQPPETALQTLQTALSSLIARRKVWDVDQGHALQSLQGWHDVLEHVSNEPQEVSGFDKEEAFAFRASLWAGEFAESPSLHVGIHRFLLCILSARILSSQSSLTRAESLSAVFGIARASGLWGILERTRRGTVRQSSGNQN